MSGRTLVVGASGFLGSAVTRQLQEAGTIVVGTAHKGVVPVSGVETIEYDFWSDDLGAILDAGDVERIVFAATVERGGGHNREAFERVVPEPVPPEVDYPRDTSLTSDRLESVLGSDPLPVSEALEAARF